MTTPTFIEFHENYDIRLTFVQATGLPLRVGNSNPYLVAKVRTLSFRTRTEADTFNPKWNEEWWISNCPLGALIDIDIFDYNFVKRDELIGSVSFFFAGELEEVTKTQNIMLKDLDQGVLTVKLVAQPSIADGAQLRSTGPVKYEQHNSYVVGTITQDEEQSYPVYKVYLPLVRTWFHETSDWNANYEPARTIFAQTPKGFIARTFIHSIHEALYRPKPTSNYGVLDTGMAFLELLKFGQRNNHVCCYSYVMVGDYMKFSEAGAPYFASVLSKHAMHADCATEVFYAGEFYIAPEQESWTLYIDNNSGTYTPNKEDLPCLEACLCQHFPDLNVVTLDRESPKLLELKGLCQQTQESNEHHSAPAKLKGIAAILDVCMGPRKPAKTVRKMSPKQPDGFTL